MMCEIIWSLALSNGAVHSISLLTAIFEYCRLLNAIFEYRMGPLNS